MRCRIVCLLTLSLALPCSLFADFHYTETTKITGGSMMSMMKVAGAFSKQARQIGEPTTSTVYVKGNRMARISPDSAEIIDLDKETVTHIDNIKKQYYTITFQQMKEQMEQAQREAASHTKQPAPDASNAPQMKFDVAVRNTGATKQYSGLQTTESILTLTVQSTDQKSGQTGNIAMTNDLWLAPEIPGYKEVRDFNQRYAKKLGEIYGAAMAPMLNSMSQQMPQAQAKPGTSQGYTEMAREVSKLKGIPIYTVMRMGSSVDGKPIPAASEAPLPAGAEPPSGGDVAKQGASSALASKLGGLGSMMGGFGRKKKQDNPPPAENSPQPTPASAVLMETTSEMADFSTAPIDGSHFLPPTGYQQIPIPDRHSRQ